MFAKKTLMSLCFLLTSMLSAKIQESDSIAEVVSEVDSKTVVLFDLDETLIETPVMLGGKAWRSYARKILERTKSSDEAGRIQDEITYFLAKRVPYTAVETTTVGHLKELQKRKIPIYGFTARGKEHWYDLPAPDAEELALLHLRQAGIDFSNPFLGLPRDFFSHWSYGQGIFFAYPVEDKGDLVLDLFERINFRPSKVVFVDDKLVNVLAVDRAFERLGISAVCFFYRHVDVHRSFDPMIAHIQLEKLLFENWLLSDEEARALKKKYEGEDPDAFFLKLISCFSLQNR